MPVPLVRARRASRPSSPVAPATCGRQSLDRPPSGSPRCRAPAPRARTAAELRSSGCRHRRASRTFARLAASALARTSSDPLRATRSATQPLSEASRTRSARRTSATGIEALSSVPSGVSTVLDSNAGLRSKPTAASSSARRASGFGITPPSSSQIHSSLRRAGCVQCVGDARLGRRGSRLLPKERLGGQASLSIAPRSRKDHRDRHRGDSIISAAYHVL